MIAFLLAEGLLKVDQRSELSSIELSHDRLVKPVLEEYDARKQRAALEEQKRRDRKLVFAGVLIVLLAIMGALLLKGRDDQILAGQDTIRVQKDTVEEQKISFREYQETTAEPIAEAARLYLALAQRAASENDTVRADSLIKQASYAAVLARNKGLQDSIAKVQLRLSARAGRPPANPADRGPEVYRIDVFYDERTQDRSEATADFVVAQLKTNPAYIVTKKRLNVSRIKISSYNIQRNTIRYEKNDQERKLAESLIRKLNAYDYIQGRTAAFTGEQVRSGFRKPNYISMFIRD